MAKCKFIDPETGRQCGMQAQVLGDGAGWCVNHDPALAEAKREWSARGGRTSRKVELIDVDEVEPIEDVVDLKRFLNSLLQWTIEGRVTPTQARSLVNVSNALKDTLALELFEMLQRLEEIEQQVDTMTGGKQWLLLDEQLPNDSGEDSD
jgi:hypothetical protein